jgi:hypothetical protein
MNVTVRIAPRAFHRQDPPCRGHGPDVVPGSARSCWGLVRAMGLDGVPVGVAAVEQSMRARQGSVTIREPSYLA